MNLLCVRIVWLINKYNELYISNVHIKICPEGLCILLGVHLFCLQCYTQIGLLGSRALSLYPSLPTKSLLASSPFNSLT